MSIYEIAQRFTDWLNANCSAALNYPIDWSTAFGWVAALIFVWVALAFLMAAEKARKDVRNKRKQISELTFDPDEIVTFAGSGKMTLQSAIAQFAAMPPSQRIRVTISRKGAPSTLDYQEIEVIAARPKFRTQTDNKQ